MKRTFLLVFALIACSNLVHADTWMPPQLNYHITYEEPFELQGDWSMYVIALTDDSYDYEEDLLTYYTHKQQCDRASYFTLVLNPTRTVQDNLDRRYPFHQIYDVNNAHGDKLYYYYSYENDTNCIVLGKNVGGLHGLEDLLDNHYLAINHLSDGFMHRAQDVHWCWSAQCKISLTEVGVYPTVLVLESEGTNYEVSLLYTDPIDIDWTNNGLLTIPEWGYDEQGEFIFPERGEFPDSGYNVITMEGLVWHNANQYDDTYPKNMQTKEMENDGLEEQTLVFTNETTINQTHENNTSQEQEALPDEELVIVPEEQVSPEPIIVEKQNLFQHIARFFSNLFRR